MIVRRILYTPMMMMMMIMMMMTILEYDSILLITAECVVVLTDCRCALQVYSLTVSLLLLKIL